MATILLLASALWLCALLCSASSPPLLVGKRTSENEISYELTITVDKGSPDCGVTRDLILVNGLFQPSIEALVNDTLKVHAGGALMA